MKWSPGGIREGAARDSPPPPGTENRALHAEVLEVPGIWRGMGCARPRPPNLLASLLPRVDARLGLGVGEGLRPDGTEAYATFYTPNNLAWAGDVPGGVLGWRSGARGGARAPPNPPTRRANRMGGDGDGGG